MHSTATHSFFIILFYSFKYNSMRYSWTFEEVDAKLQGIMKGIYHNVADAAKTYGCAGNLEAGANIAGFLKVADAMLAQGVC